MRVAETEFGAEKTADITKARRLIDESKEDIKSDQRYIRAMAKRIRKLKLLKNEARAKEKKLLAAISEERENALVLVHRSTLMEATFGGQKEEFYASLGSVFKSFAARAEVLRKKEADFQRMARELTAKKWLSREGQGLLPRRQGTGDGGGGGAGGGGGGGGGGGEDNSVSSWPTWDELNTIVHQPAAMFGDTVEERAARAAEQLAMQAKHAVTLRPSTMNSRNSPRGTRSPAEPAEGAAAVAPDSPSAHRSSLAPEMAGPVDTHNLLLQATVALEIDPGAQAPEIVEIGSSGEVVLLAPPLAPQEPVGGPVFNSQLTNSANISSNLLKWRKRRPGERSVPIDSLRREVAARQMSSAARAEPLPTAQPQPARRKSLSSSEPPAAAAAPAPSGRILPRPLKDSGIQPATSFTRKWLKRDGGDGEDGRPPDAQPSLAGSPSDRDLVARGFKNARARGALQRGVAALKTINRLKGGKAGGSSGGDGDQTDGDGDDEDLEGARAAVGALLGGGGGGGRGGWAVPPDSNDPADVAEWVIHHVLKRVHMQALPSADRAAASGAVIGPWATQKAPYMMFDPVRVLRRGPGERFEITDPLELVQRHIYQIYRFKVSVDQGDRLHRTPVQHMQPFLHYFFMFKYSVREIADVSLLDLLDHVSAYAPVSPRCHMFGRFCQLWDPLPVTALTFYLELMGFLEETCGAQAFTASEKNGIIRLPLRPVTEGLSKGLDWIDTDDLKDCLATILKLPRHVSAAAARQYRQAASALAASHAEALARRNVAWAEAEVALTARGEAERALSEALEVYDASNPLFAEKFMALRGQVVECEGALAGKQAALAAVVKEAGLLLALPGFACPLPPQPVPDEVDFDEVLQVAMRYYEQYNERHVDQLFLCFQAADMEQNGTLTYDEFRGVLRTLDAATDDRSVLRLFRVGLSATLVYQNPYSKTSYDVEGVTWASFLRVARDFPLLHFNADAAKLMSELHEDPGAFHARLVSLWKDHQPHIFSQLKALKGYHEQEVLSYVSRRIRHVETLLSDPANSAVTFYAIRMAIEELNYAVAMTQSIIKADEEEAAYEKAKIEEAAAARGRLASRMRANRVPAIAPELMEAPSDSVRRYSVMGDVSEAAAAAAAAARLNLAFRGGGGDGGPNSRKPSLSPLSVDPSSTTAAAAAAAAATTTPTAASVDSNFLAAPASGGYDPSAPRSKRTMSVLDTLPAPAPLIATRAPELMMIKEGEDEDEGDDDEAEEAAREEERRRRQRADSKGSSGAPPSRWNALEVVVEEPAIEARRISNISAQGRRSSLVPQDAIKKTDQKPRPPPTGKPTTPQSPRPGQSSARRPGSGLSPAFKD